MNFLEALKALKDRKCRAIKRNIWEHRTFVIGRECLHDTRNNCPAFDLMGVDNILADDWILVDPKPQYEEVEVVMYVERAPSGEMGMIKNIPFNPCRDMNLVKLTGIDTVPVKPKVKQRKYLGTLDVNLRLNEIPMSAGIFAEWEE